MGELFCWGLIHLKCTCDLVGKGRRIEVKKYNMTLVNHLYTVSSVLIFE